MGPPVPLGPGDRLRLHLRSFSQDSERQQELDGLVRNSDSLESQFLLLAQQRATRELTLQGERQPKQIYLFATYTIEPGKDTASDQVEKLVAWIVERYDTIKGLKERKEQQHYLQMLTRAFTDGYLHWEQQINSRMGLQAAPMMADALWVYLWEQFNHRQAPPIPQCMTLMESAETIALQEDIQDPYHAASVLIRGENGMPSHPKADRQ